MDINYFKAALSHHSKGNWNKAQEIYQHLLKENPNNYAVLQNYGPLLAQLREYKLKKDVFQKCLKIKPNDLYCYTIMENFFMIKKIMKRLLSTIINHLKKIQRTLWHNIILEIFILQKNNLKMAIDKFKKVTEINPSHSFAYNNIGLALKKLGNFDGA